MNLSDIPEAVLEKAVSTGIWALVVLVLACIALRGFRQEISSLLRRIRKVGGAELDPQAQQTTQPPPTPVAPPQPVPPVATEPGTNHARVVEEVEAWCAAQDPVNLATVMRQALVEALVGIVMEQQNFQIFGSQLRLLLDLNTVSHPRATVQSIYERAAADEPGFYSTYSFDQWLQWMKDKQLIDETGGQVEIRPAGRELLKFLIGRGYPFVRPH